MSQPFASPDTRPSGTATATGTATGTETPPLTPNVSNRDDLAISVKTVLRPLYPHQEAAIDFFRKGGHKHPALFMEMRLGKSLALLRWLEERSRAEGAAGGHRLIVAPLDVLRSWRKELQQEGLPYVDLAACHSRQARINLLRERRPGYYYLANYELVRSIPDIAAMRWYLCAADESTRIKNATALTTKLFVTGFRNVDHRAILSGMPAPETALELYCQFQFLHGIFMQCRNFWQFRNTFFEPRVEWIGMEKRVTGHVLKDGVYNVLTKIVAEKAYVLSRKQVNIGSAKVYEQRTVAMPPALKKTYVEVEKNFEFQGREIQWAMVAETWLGRLAGGFSPVAPFDLLSSHKADAALSLFTEGDLRHEQFVIWCRFNREIAYLRERFGEAGISVKAVTGESPPEYRSSAIDALEAGRAQGLIAQGACARYGLDFSAADTEIYYSNHYSNEIRTQSEDRIVHPAKTSPLLVVDTITEGTVDEDVVAILQDKKFRSQTLMEAASDRNQTLYARLRAGIESRKATYMHTPTRGRPRLTQHE